MKTVTAAAVQLSPVLYKGSEYDSSNYRKISITPMGKPPPLAVRLAQALPFRRA